MSEKDLDQRRVTWSDLYFSRISDCVIKLPRSGKGRNNRFGGYPGGRWLGNGQITGVFLKAEVHDP